MKKKTRIVVIIEGGLVRDVLCSQRDVEVDVVDLDTEGRDLDEVAEVEAAAETYEAEVKAGTLFEVA